MKPKTEEHKRKIALAHIGKKASPETLKKLSAIKSSPENIRKSIANLPKEVAGEKNGMYGKKHTAETKGKISRANMYRYRGEKSPNWKGGTKSAAEVIRYSTEYKLWRKAVFERDKYQCIWGGLEHGNKLEADHIKPFSLFPELRFALDNGRTLCRSCHRKTDTWGNRIKNYKTN